MTATSDPRELVGRAATPVPPNVGASTLGAALGLRDAPRHVQRRYVLAVVGPALFDDIEQSADAVFPAIPGLAAESLQALSVRCLVIEEAALHRGVWAGVLKDWGEDLRTELVDLLELARGAGIPVYWVRRLTPRPEVHEDGVARSPGREPEEAGLPGLPCPGGILIAPGSALCAGTEEGAPPTRLVSVLRRAALAEPSAG